MPFIHSIGDFLNPDRVIAILTLIVASIAAYYAWRAPDKRDLKRVEDHTAATSGHLEGVKTNIARMDRRMDTQHEHDTLVKWAGSTVISVAGSGDGGDPISVHVTSPAHNVIFSRVDLLMESGNAVTTLPCEKRENPTTFIVHWHNLLAWMGGGTRIVGKPDKALYLRVYMYFKGHEEEVSRLMTVYQIGNQSRVGDAPGHIIAVYRIEGTIT